MSDERPTLTAAELIEALKLIPGDTVISWSDADYDYDSLIYWGVAGVGPDGDMEHGAIVSSCSLSDHFNEADDDDE